MSEFLFVEEYLDSTIQLSKTVPLRVQFVVCLNNKKAFTLAEVLITLGIIGVVAAMTIPTLINNYQKSQYVTQLKKAYTTFNQALIQMAADHNCPGDLKCTGLFDVTSTTQSLGDEFVKYFKVLENCKQSGECKSTEYSYNYTGTPRSNVNWAGGGYSFITADGQSFYIANYRNNCSSSSGISQVCALVEIDTNGKKLPNNLGLDQFRFYIINDDGPLLYPEGGKKFAEAGYWWKRNASCTPTNPAGSECAGRVIEEGWQMNYTDFLPDPYAAGIIPDNSTLIAVGRTLQSYTVLFRGTAKATLAQGYYTDLRERQIIV